MARLRPYSVTFTNVSVSVVQDLFGIYCGTAQVVEFHGLVLGQITGVVVQNLRFRVIRLPTTVTPGSGGTTITPRPQEPGDAASTISSAHLNDTTQATTNGTAAVMLSDVYNTINGYQFFWPSDDRPAFGLSQAGIVSLDSAPSGALSMSGSLFFAERV